MIDCFAIISRGGAVLWQQQGSALKGDPVGALIRQHLAEERLDEAFDYSPSPGVSYGVKWLSSNQNGLLFVAVHDRSSSSLFVADLLKAIKRDFSKVYQPGIFSYPEYDANFKAIHARAEAQVDERRAAAKGPSDAHAEPDARGAAQAVEARLSAEDTNEGAAEGGAEANDAVDISKLKGKVKGKAKKRSEQDLFAAMRSNSKKKDRPKGKEMRRWDGSKDDYKGPLDLSTDKPAKEEAEGTMDVSRAAASRMDAEGESEESDEEEVEVASKGLLGGFMQTLRTNITGKESLTRQDLQPALDAMRRQLLERNVAEEISSKLCETVAAKLSGTSLSSFTRVSTVVKRAFEEALVRVLTPKRSIDVLAEIRAAQARNTPYTMVFVGVNGVGKSTNLAKVAYWLLQNKVKVMIAACDTFRSGAVEQLRTHCHRLDVPLFERGYEKDPAQVAQEAIKQAKRMGVDVLLIDTAGRMQDNEPLMRALANLINLNQPDLTLFVGEALVGNDAVDQLTKFNRRLSDLASGTKRHLIDGIVLTKFDTIDTKVGAALSMVYTSGAPIMFVGVGQNYPDLSRLNIKAICKSLLG
ncbi:unnamed protein product [Pedinophyceae sp. YPF-701]|nr:unnamed protein product [Pedinophyceae sp. YPF-701]